MVQTRYVGSSRQREGGYSATHKRDFAAHIEGGDWYHGATDILMDPPITDGAGSFTGTTVQETIQSIVNTYISGGQGFVTIGDGYDNSAQDLALAFTGAFANPRLDGGGIVLVKAGTYSIQNTVTVPPGITIMGESAGSLLIAETGEQPMFVVQASNLQPQTGTAMSESQDKTTFVGLVFYDNLNQASSALITTAMIRAQRGSDLTLDGCFFIGKAVSTTNITNRVVEHITGATSKSTILTVRNCYADNVASVIEFSAALGVKDHLTVESNRFYTYGTGVSASAVDRCAISSTNCTLTVKNNYHRGLFTTWGATYFIHIVGTFVSDSGTDFNLFGNHGGIDGGGSPIFINNEPMSSNIAKHNTWGDGDFKAWGIDVDGYGNVSMFGSLDVDGDVKVDGYLVQTAHDSVSTPGASTGLFWVEDGSPTTPKFTDSDGTTMDLKYTTVLRVEPNGGGVTLDLDDYPWAKWFICDVVGGGGGGGGSYPDVGSNSGGGGGSGGRRRIWVPREMVEGTVLRITPGAGGAGGSVGNNGADGVNSTVIIGTGFGSNLLLTVPGGRGGRSQYNGGAGYCGGGSGVIEGGNNGYNGGSLATEDGYLGAGGGSAGGAGIYGTNAVPLATRYSLNEGGFNYGGGIPSTGGPGGVNGAGGGGGGHGHALWRTDNAPAGWVPAGTQSNTDGYPGPGVGAGGGGGGYDFGGTGNRPGLRGADGGAVITII